MSESDRSLSQYFTKQHREADDFWAATENAVESRDDAAIGKAFSAFNHSLRQHLLLEEEVLFPAFEEATGIVQGPTMVMRAEHRQMRALLDQMNAALAASDYDTLMDAGDTLFTLISQHNMKEEGMLYRMSEQALSDAWPSLRERARKYE